MEELEVCFNCQDSKIFWSVNAISIPLLPYRLVKASHIQSLFNPCEFFPNNLPLLKVLQTSVIRGTTQCAVALEMKSWV